MIDLDADGELGVVHRMPIGPRAVRWACLFSSPFFHSTVAVDRAVLERERLRYDTSFGESEDYDLWSRLLSVADGDNIGDALVLYRKHEAQASARRATLQRECQRRSRCVRSARSCRHSTRRAPSWPGSSVPAARACERGR